MAKEKDDATKPEDSPLKGAMVTALAELRNCDTQVSKKTAALKFAKEDREQAQQTVNSIAGQFAGIETPLLNELDEKDE